MHRAHEVVRGAAQVLDAEFDGVDLVPDRDGLGFAGRPPAFELLELQPELLQRGEIAAAALVRRRDLGAHLLQGGPVAQQGLFQLGFARIRVAKVVPGVLQLSLRGHKCDVEIAHDGGALCPFPVEPLDAVGEGSQVPLDVGLTLAQRFDGRAVPFDFQAQRPELLGQRLDVVPVPGDDVLLPVSSQTPPARSGPRCRSCRARSS